MTPVQTAHTAGEAFTADALRKLTGSGRSAYSVYTFRMQSGDQTLMHRAVLSNEQNDEQSPSYQRCIKVCIIDNIRKCVKPRHDYACETFNFLK